jgi:hypothetical protein
MKLDIKFTLQIPDVDEDDFNLRKKDIRAIKAVIRNAIKFGFSGGVTVYLREDGHTIEYHYPSKIANLKIDDA